MEIFHFIRDGSGMRSYPIMRKRYAEKDCIMSVT